MKPFSLPLLSPNPLLLRLPHQRAQSQINPAPRYHPFPPPSNFENSSSSHLSTSIPYQSPPTHSNDHGYTTPTSTSRYTPNTTSKPGLPSLTHLKLVSITPYILCSHVYQHLDVSSSFSLHVQSHFAFKCRKGDSSVLSTSSMRGCGGESPARESQQQICRTEK